MIVVFFMPKRSFIFGSVSSELATSIAGGVCVPSYGAVLAYCGGTTASAVSLSTRADGAMMKDELGRDDAGVDAVRRRA